MSFGKPMDVFGNMVNIEGESIDARGQEVEVKDYFSSNGVLLLLAPLRSVQMVCYNNGVLLITTSSGSNVVVLITTSFGSNVVL